MPGIAASTSETWLLGSPPNSVEAPENSFDFEVTWACTSSPITTSQSPVWPLISFPGLTDAFMLFHSRAARTRSAPIRLPENPLPPAGRPGGTSSRHCRDRLPPGADRRAPRRSSRRSRPARSCAHDPSRPWRPTTAQSAAVPGQVPAQCPREWRGNLPSLPPPLWREAAGGLLHDFAEREQRLLVERTADQLQAKRQALRVLAGGHGDARQSRHVHRHRKNVVEVHLDRIGALLADAERRRWRRRSQDRADTLGEAILKILLDQGADFLRAQIIGVVIAGGKHIGADHDAAADFVAKTLGAGVLVQFADRTARHAQAVAHAVVAREVGRGF